MTIQESFGPQQNELFGSQGIDLLHYSRVVRESKFSILALGLVAAVIGGLYAMSRPDIYESTASLLIQGNQAQFSSIQQFYGMDTQQAEYFATQHEILKSRHLAERVIDELDLVRHTAFVPAESSPGFMTNLQSKISGLFTDDAGQDANLNASQAEPEPVSVGSLVRRFGRQLSISPIRNTHLVEISFEASDPRLAADVANSLAKAYIEDNLEQRLAASQTANVLLTGRLEVLRETLEDSELKLQQYLEKEQLVNVGNVTALNVQELDQLTSQAIDVTRVRAEAEGLHRQIQQLTGTSTDELMTIPAILNQGSVQGLRREFDNVNRDIAELSKRYGPNHPRMIALDSQRSAIETNLSRQVQQVLASIENQYRTAQENERATLARLDESKAELQKINSNNFVLHELEREVETNRQLYDLFFTRIRETDETDSFLSTNAMVVDPAVPPRSSSKSDARAIVLLAGMLGLIFGTAIAFLRDLMNNTIKVPADVEQKLMSNVLGLLPLAEQPKSTRKNPLAYIGFRDDQLNSFTESVRTLRTGITLTSLDKPHKLIEVTSSVTSEGKTTVAINLAVATGQLGRTLLIDADLRKPSVGKSIGLASNLPGLTNLVIEGIEARDRCIHLWEEGGISVLPAGHYVSNPLELISSKKFRELLFQLRVHFDTIIVDTPPINAVSDSLILCSMADAVAYVVKADSTSISSIRSGLSRLQKANANMIGVILNQVDTRKQAYYGEGDYYSGLYDTYGYSGKPKTASAS